MDKLVEYFECDAAYLVGGGIAALAALLCATTLWLASIELVLTMICFGVGHWLYKHPVVKKSDKKEANENVDSK